MRVVRLSGQGGYEPGKIEADTTSKVSLEDWKHLRDSIAKAQFWQMPTKEVSNIPTSDGSQWILEGRARGKYHVVDASTPSSEAYYDCCRFFISREIGDSKR